MKAAEKTDEKEGWCQMIRLDTLRTFMTGALRIWEEDGYFRFSRFTEKQEAVLEANGYEHQYKASTGMRLEFMSCGGVISFAYKTSPASGSGEYFGIEITADQLPIYHLYQEEMADNGMLCCRIPDTEKPCHVVVYFPNLAKLQIKELVIPEDSAPVSKSRKILMTGDSITQGYWSKHMNLTYSNILADALGADLLNQSIGGARFCEDYLDSELPFVPDVITVAYGVNDWAGGVLWSGAAERYLEKLHALYPHQKIFILLPIWYAGGTADIDGRSLQDGRQYIRSCAQKYANMQVLDGLHFVPHLPEFYWDNEQLHPNDMGFLQYGYQLTREIKAYL